MTNAKNKGLEMSTQVLKLMCSSQKPNHKLKNNLCVKSFVTFDFV